MTTEPGGPELESLMGLGNVGDLSDLKLGIDIPEKRRKGRRGESSLVVEKRTNIYRKSVLGRTLTSSLAQLLSDGKIQGSLAEIVLQQFDRSVARNLPYVPQTMSFVSGGVVYYRLLGNCWKFKLKDIIFSEPHKELAHVDSCTILAALPEDISI